VSVVPSLTVATRKRSNTKKNILIFEENSEMVLKLAGLYMCACGILNAGKPELEPLLGYSQNQRAKETLIVIIPH
jgi:hypothetical protein